MKLTALCAVRRYINSPHHPMNPYPKKDRWWKRQRVFRFTAWSWSDGRDKYRRAILQAQKIWEWETEKREDAPKLKKHYDSMRIEAACREHKIEIKHFMTMLRKAKIELNQSMLATLAIWEPRSFKSLVDLTKEMAEGGDWYGYNKEAAPAENVFLRGKISHLDEPIPRSREYPVGPAENFRTSPRKLKPEEY